MAKLIKILAVSIGGGLVLGAGIRLGEAIAAKHPPVGPDVGRRLSERLGNLENRLMDLEAEIPATVGSRQLRGEKRDWLEESLAARMAEVELRLQAESERGQKQVLDAFAESVQTRVIQRLSKLEEEVADQSAAMSELRECSLRTERSIQKLLGGLDRIIVRQPPPEEPVNPTVAVRDGVSPANITRSQTSSEIDPLPVHGEALATQPAPPHLARHFESKRWMIFG